MNYNEFDNILFESKLGRNALKKAFAGYAYAHDNRGHYQPTISDIKKDIKKIIAIRNERAKNIKIHKSDVPKEIKRELLDRQHFDNEKINIRQNHRSHLRELTRKRKKQEELNKYRKLFKL